MIAYPRPINLHLSKLVVFSGRERQVSVHQRISFMVVLNPEHFAQICIQQDRQQHAFDDGIRWNSKSSHGALDCSAAQDCGVLWHVLSQYHSSILVFQISGAFTQAFHDSSHN